MTASSLIRQIINLLYNFFLTAKTALAAFGLGWWAYLDSNQGPTGYEPVALAN